MHAVYIVGSDLHTLAAESVEDLVRAMRAEKIERVELWTSTPSDTSSVHVGALELGGGSDIE